jgi:hypothetical protein
MNPFITALKGGQGVLISGVAYVAGSLIAPVFGIDKQVAVGVCTTIITGIGYALVNYLKNRKN